MKQRRRQRTRQSSAADEQAGLRVVVQDETGLDLGGDLHGYILQLLGLAVVRACRACKVKVCVDSAPSSCSEHSECTGTGGGTRRRLAQQAAPPAS